MRVLSILGLVILAAPLGAQEPPGQWDRYVPRRLQAIIDDHRAGVLEDPTGAGADSVRVLSADDFPTQAELVFVGHSRPVPRLKREFLVHWLRAFVKDTASARLYTQELLFREDTTEHWMPVQDGMPEWLRDNVRAGERTTVFVMFLGALRIHGKVEWMFVVTGI